MILCRVEWLYLLWWEGGVFGVFEGVVVFNMFLMDVYLLCCMVFVVCLNG